MFFSETSKFRKSTKSNNNSLGIKVKGETNLAHAIVGMHDLCFLSTIVHFVNSFYSQSITRSNISVILFFSFTPWWFFLKAGKRLSFRPAIYEINHDPPPSGKEQQKLQFDECTVCTPSLTANRTFTPKLCLKKSDSHNFCDKRTLKTKYRWQRAAFYQIQFKNAEWKCQGPTILMVIRQLSTTDNWVRGKTETWHTVST